MDSSNDLLTRRTLPVRRQAQIVLLLVLGAAGILLLGWGASRLHAAQPDAHGQAPSSTSTNELRLTATQLATLTIQPVETLAFRSEEKAQGRIALNGDTTTPVFSQYSGQVVRVIAPIGAQVKRGAPLYSIKATEFAQTHSDLLNAISQLKLAKIAEERRHAAFDSKGGSLQDWQQSQADLAAAQITLESARNRLQILGLSSEQIATLEHSQVPDPVTVVPAPIDGTVTDRQVGPGEFLQAGSSTPVYTIGNLASVWLVADVPETDAPLIEVGQSVEVSVLALPGKIFKAKLTTVGASVDPVTRRVPVRGTIDNSDGKLKPEMFASFDIITSAESRAPAVPEEAVVREGDQARVWVVKQNNDLALRQIRTGRVQNGMVEVLAGLRSGERIVTRGSLFIDRAAQPG